MAKTLNKKELIKGAQNASSTSIKKSLSAGHSVTIQKGKSIVRLSSDGREELVRKIDSAYKIAPKKTYSIK